MKILTKILITALFFLYGSEVFAGRCWAKFSIMNKTGKEITVKKIHYKEKHGNWRGPENVNIKISSTYQASRTTLKQRLVVHDGEFIEAVNAEYRIGRKRKLYSSKIYGIPTEDEICFDGQVYFVPIPNRP